MKSMVVYYSYSSSAKLAAKLLEEFLKEKGEVDTLELKGGIEIREFMGLKDHYVQEQQDSIQKVNFDLSTYDLVLFGISVWVSETTNIMSNYLDQCFGLEGKRVILYIISGGMGDQACFDHVDKILSKKGAKVFKRVSVGHDIARDKDKLDKFIRETLQFYV